MRQGEPGDKAQAVRRRELEAGIRHESIGGILLTAVHDNAGGHGRHASKPVAPQWLRSFSRQSATRQTPGPQGFPNEGSGRLYGQFLAKGPQDLPPKGAISGPAMT